MGIVLFESGCLFLEDKEETSPLTSSEICSILFEGNTTIRNRGVTREDFLSLGLRYSEYTATPNLVLRFSSKKNPQEIEYRLVATSTGFEAEVAFFNGSLLDYACDGTVWMPMPTGTADTATEYFGKLGMGIDGSLTLSQYLRLIKAHEPVFPIIDRTKDAFSSKVLSASLRGKLPAGFEGNLYSYQEAGYYWLSYMRRMGLGCILADEMGLGKTIQVICLLIEAKNTGHTPSLIITPATLLENWFRELRKFAPVLKVHIHSGVRRTGFPDELKSADVIICSYDTAVSDISLLHQIFWEFLVLDEAQAIKNPEARRTIKLKTLLRGCSIAITGTPLENRLMDIWSITDFAIPSLLGSKKEFEENFPDSIDNASTLEPILTPIILRRKVSEVAKDLPERIDIPQPLELDEESAESYEELRHDAANNQKPSLATLVRLRMFCTHPWLVDRCTENEMARSCSPKLERLLEILDEIISNKDKALIFTSFQKSIDLLTKEIGECFAIPTAFIDGRVQVDRRQPLVDAFSNLDRPAILILNPHAAGTGLNITAANHVIHFNLEWNPAIEDQASARAYRRGQKYPVTVHRMFYINTVEDIINDRMERKRNLASAAVIGTDGKSAEMEDIMAALRVSPVST